MIAESRHRASREAYSCESDTEPGGIMKAVRLHTYDQPLRLDEIPEPTISSPHDVIVRIAGAGLCRTDLHIQQGWFSPLGLVDLPCTLGHENAGWIHEVGAAVDNVAVGDAVICHPQLSCGVC